MVMIRTPKRRKEYNRLKELEKEIYHCGEIYLDDSWENKDEYLKLKRKYDRKSK